MNHVSIIIGMLMVVSAFDVFAALNADQISAKNKGLYLYNLIRHEEAIPYLKPAADAGDVDAQYYLAEIIRQGKMMMTEEAYKLYESAAKQGSVDAMIRLADTKDDLCVIAGSCPLGEHTPDEWFREAQKTAEARAQSGDNEAMRQLFGLTGELRFLIQGAEAGNGEAQYKLSSLYDEGLGFFIFPGSREKEAEKWLARSAESGYPRAMNDYGHLLVGRGEKKNGGEWIEKAAKTGYMGALSSYLVYTAHMPNKVDYPLDYVKAYGLALLFRDSEPETSNLSFGKKMLARVAPKMNQQQIIDAQYFAEQWKRNYPPLSEFRPKYTY
ncbi:tetratricopeptide repeat protein [Pseudomonas syringae]|uniref:tetratricopeptide repeat protein n=1 Tax=Pseudomonas syringae TaxID=317 RepID=UPI00147E6C33|nr:SEL1-like repeat protein [Pseudomonas syringae]